MYAIIGSAIDSATFLLKSACSFNFPEALSKRAITPTIATDKPNVSVAVRACAATVEIPYVVATLKFIAAHISFALDKTVILKAPSAETCF